MFHFRHKTLIFISAVIWLGIGVMLLRLGLRFIVESQTTSAPLLSPLSAWFGGVEAASILLIAFALLIGFLKGRFVLEKSAKRLLKRIRSLPEPLAIHRLYGVPYYFLIALMMGLGIGMNVFKVPLDIRGFIDVAVGAALINGGSRLARCAATYDKGTLS